MGTSTVPSFASDTNDQFSVRGLGGQNCANWVQLTETADDTQRRDAILNLQSWLAGYITASNRLKSETYDVLPFIDMINVLAIVLNECRARPADLGETTVARVLAAFEEARVKAESSVVIVQDNGTEKAYWQSTIHLIQTRLVEMGFLSDEPDGQLGPMTQRALYDYQSQVGLEANGELTVDTLFKLLIE